MLPSDTGGSTATPGWPFASAVDFAQDAVGDLVTELSSFTKFRNRIDELLDDLKASPADSRKLGEDRVTRPQFGGGTRGEWHEADELHGAYRTVIKELEQLSKLLSDSIEGMGIAVLASHKGYENLDLDIRERMLAIKSNAQEHYGGEYDPPKAGAEQGTDRPAESGKPADRQADTSGVDGL
ncbi:hypothetical protein ABZS81_22795 [Streptomyces sp. NPDC005318]|uniref:hypothetical protein n=1 Tax=Streptomyces sp. NPDC005318 TaxID=3157031 RepID=UPI0033A0FE6A